MIDINPDLLSEFEYLRVEVSNSPSTLAANHDFVITVQPNADIVESVVFRKNGLFFGFQPGSTLIDLTSSVLQTTKIGRKLNKNEVKMLVAPVSGGFKRQNNNYGAGGGVEMSFGGYRKSGFGREKGLETLQQYTQVKNVAFKLSVEFSQRLVD